jgi:hypothetical protein
MAVNHADGTLFVSILFYPTAAALAAARNGADWFTILFALAGLAFGVLVIYLGRKLVYAITHFGLYLASKIRNKWIQQVFFTPFFLLYLILPYATIWTGIMGAWYGSIWLVRHLL